MYRSSTDARVLSLADQVSSANRAACPPPAARYPSRNRLKVSIQVAANYSPAEMTSGVRVPYSHGYGPQRRIRSPPVWNRTCPRREGTKLFIASSFVRTPPGCYLAGFV